MKSSLSRDRTWTLLKRRVEHLADERPTIAHGLRQLVATLEDEADRQSPELRRDESHLPKHLRLEYMCRQGPFTLPGKRKPRKAGER